MAAVRCLRTATPCRATRTNPCAGSPRRSVAPIGALSALLDAANPPAEIAESLRLVRALETPEARQAVPAFARRLAEA